MTDIDVVLSQLTARYAELKEVEGVLLAGSRTTNLSDKNSDIDLYIYGKSIIPLEKRKIILRDFSDQMEYNNQYWETEDDGYLRDPNIAIDIVYRDLNWILGELERVVLKHQAGTGYSTCIWFNFINSKILFDRSGELAALQKKFNIPYPHELKLNIIKKNYPLLRESVCSYYRQIEKALGRNDFISVNHRTAAFFESYFDIIFAINETPHPGEKKLMKIVLSQCPRKPENLENNVQAILSNINSSKKHMLSALDELVDNLDILLQNENI